MIQVSSHAWVNPAHVSMIEGGEGGFMGTKAGPAIVTLICGKRVQTEIMPEHLLRMLAQPKIGTPDDD